MRGFFGGGGDAGGVGGGRFLPKRESKASVGMIVQVNVEQVGTHFIHARMFYERARKRIGRKRIIGRSD